MLQISLFSIRVCTAKNITNTFVATAAPDQHLQKDIIASMNFVRFSPLGGRNDILFVD